MEALTDKAKREQLIERYLEAETCTAEEALLAEYFAEHRPDADEEAVARLVLAERPEAMLTAGEREFGPETAADGQAGQDGVTGRDGANSLCGNVRLPEHRAFHWRLTLAGLAAAAALALFLLLRPTAHEAPAFTPLEIAESLNTIMDLGLGDVESATATPSGANLIVTVRLKDGSTLPFIMSRDGETGTLSLASTE